MYRMFNEALAEQLVVAEDRNDTPVFAGRQREIESFRTAVSAAKDRAEKVEPSQSVFRVYQGAPGCGKTSLINNLRAQFSRRMLFVEMEDAELGDINALRDKIGREAQKASVKDKWFGYATKLITNASLRSSAEEFLEMRRQALLEGLAIIVYRDEAQSIPRGHASCVAHLYRSGLSMPSVCLLAGLSHTSSVLRNIPGLSRLGDSAVLNMQALSADESTESTLNLLNQLDVRGRREDAAVMVAGSSYGWPQHLFCAQRALCRELLTNACGDLGRIDWNAVKKETALARESYYQGRLEGSVLEMNPVLTAEIVAGVARRGTANKAGLQILCRDRINDAVEAGSLPEAIPFAEFADNLIEKGVLSVVPGGRYEVAIPSMLTWLERLAEAQAHGEDID